MATGAGAKAARLGRVGVVEAVGERSGRGGPCGSQPLVLLLLEQQPLEVLQREALVEVAPPRLARLAQLLDQQVIGAEQRAQLVEAEAEEHRERRRG